MIPQEETRKKRYFTKSLFLLSLSSVMLSCSKPNDCLSPVKFAPDDQPLVYIQQPLHSGQPCSYSVRTVFQTNQGLIISDGVLVFENLKFKIKLESTEGGPITFFDFSKHVSEVYDLPIQIGRQKKVLNMRLENIIDTPFPNKVYQFRLIDGFARPGIKGDVVFFADMKRGVIGTYISDFEDNEEIIIAPRGNILRDSLDYSKKEFKILQ
jgi:hypothetical protein